MKKTDLHPLPLRVWHWANALLVLILMITGIQLRIEGVADLGPRSTSLLLHRYVGWAATASCIFWLVYSLTSRHLHRNYVFRRKDFQGIFRQARFYLFSMFRGEENPFRPSPEGKFNPLQKLAYGAIMCVFTPVLVVTGVLLNETFLFRKLILQWNIVGVLNALHVFGAYVFALYLVVHIYMATLGRTPFSHIKAMIVGYDEEPDPPGGERA
jgi:thiosulfate reductase cytochrome b subunit